MRVIDEMEMKKRERGRGESPTSIVRLAGRDKELMGHASDGEIPHVCSQDIATTGAVKTSLTVRIRVRC